MSVTTQDRADFAAAWAVWHAQKDAELAAEHGFLAVTGMFWLGDAPQQVPGVPGTWSSGPEGVRVALAPHEELRDGAGRAVTGHHALDLTAGRAQLWHERVLVEVVARAEGTFVRPRDPEHPLRTGFQGTPAYEPDPRWQLAGTFRPAVPEQVAVPSSAPGLTNTYTSPGHVDVVVDGHPRSFVAFEGKRPGTVRVVVRDATSGVTTYPSGRYVDVDVTDPSGAVVLDLNRASNFPCSYTHVPTCPVAPRQNWLDLAVEAGDRLFVRPAES